VAAFGDAATLGDSGPPPRAAPLPVTSRLLAVSDPTRASPARGSVPGHPGRDLPTLVYLPAVPATHAWPLVVFAAGFNRTPPDYAPLLTTWAAAGYVVAAPYFPGERPDIPGPATRADLTQEPGDLSVVLSGVLAASASPASWLSGLVDPTRVAVAGHSDGAAAVAGMTLDSAYHDSHVRAALILAGARLGMPGGAYGATPNVPVLIEMGTADAINNPANGDELYGGARSPRAEVRVVGGSHEGTFIGADALAAAARAVSVDFLDGELGGPGGSGGSRAGLARLVRDGDDVGVATLTADLFPESG
jgi:dienelactone hydrolase